MMLIGTELSDCDDTKQARKSVGSGGFETPVGSAQIARFWSPVIVAVGPSAMTAFELPQSLLE